MEKKINILSAIYMHNFPFTDSSVSYKVQKYVENVTYNVWQSTRLHINRLTLKNLRNANIGTSLD